MSKDIKKALKHCAEWKCDNCPNGDELGSGEIVCRGRLLPQVLEYISDLEAKLAESENKFVVANNLRKNSDEVLLNYKTEKYGLDKTIQELRKIKLSFPEKEYYYKGFENCERQMSSHIADLTLEVKELKQQLTEKEKENNELVFIIEEIEQFVWEQLNNENFDKYKAYDEMLTKIKQLIKQSPYEKQYQDKISFAVEQLEKVKEYIHGKYLDETWHNKIVDEDREDMHDYIDNQIEELKKEIMKYE